MSDSISIDLSQNFDLTAKIEYQYDQATYAVRLEEVVESADDLEVATSHLQEPLVFMRNDDKQRSVVRTLAADDVDSSPQRKHLLMFLNRQPEMLKNYAESMKNFVTRG